MTAVTVVHPTHRWWQTVFESRRAAWTLVVVASVWIATMLPVVSQEAYYWSYAQHLALSYFDHPPMVAWLIKLSTSILGDGALGVRGGALACAFGTTLLGEALLRDAGVGPRLRNLWVLGSLGVPALTMTHMLANPDGPLTFFWTATIYLLWRARRSSSLLWWLGAGVAAGCALLSKYTAAFLGLGGCLVLLLDPVMRRQLLGAGPWLALLAATATFSPVLIWNAQHDWASFRFQTESRYEKSAMQVHWLGQFVVGQLGMALPLWLLAPTAARGIWSRVRAGDTLLLWLLAFSLPLIGFMAFNALFIQVKVNWLVPTYGPLLLALLIWCEGDGGRDRHPLWYRTAGVFVGLGLGAGLLTPAIALVPVSLKNMWSGRSELAARAEHWARELDAADGVKGNFFFFGPEYKESSQLYRNLLVNVDGYDPRQPVLAQNVFGDAALAYDFWTAPADWVGGEAIFVTTAAPDNLWRQLRAVRGVFKDVRELENLVVRRLGMVVLDARLYHCVGYQGPRS